MAAERNIACLTISAIAVDFDHLPRHIAIIMDGNLIWDERYPDEAIKKIPVKEFASAIRAAWVWDKRKMEGLVK